VYASLFKGAGPFPKEPPSSAKDTVPEGQAYDMTALLELKQAVPEALVTSARSR